MYRNKYFVFYSYQDFVILHFIRNMDSHILERIRNTEINKIMKKICLLLFLFCTCIAQAQNAYRTNKDISYVSGSERIPIVWNVVNWIFIILKTRRISQLLSGFTVVVWKVEINLFPKN